MQKLRVHEDSSVSYHTEGAGAPGISLLPEHLTI